MASTIPTTTIGESIERSASTTPSDCSVYVDLDVESEHLVSPNITQSEQWRPSFPPRPPTENHESFFGHVKASAFTTSPIAITRVPEQEGLLTPLLTPETNSHESFYARTNVKWPTGQLTPCSISSLSQIVSPITIPDSSISPSSNSSSSCSTRSFSISDKFDEDSSSFLTQRSASPDLDRFATESKSTSSKPAPVKKPCLQCQLAGLRCSLAAPPCYRRKTLSPLERLCCTRCIRNGESFCILQAPISAEPNTNNLIRTRTQPQTQTQTQTRIWTRMEVRDQKVSQQLRGTTYSAEDVEVEAVLKKAHAMMEERRASRRWELPKPTVWKLEKMKPGFGWFIDGSREEWRKTHPGWRCED